MPIRRPRTPSPALRHVSFLETMASRPADDARYLAAQGAFLALRLLDHRIAFGERMTAPASQALEATRAAIAQLPVDDELRGLLAAVTDAVAAMDATDAQPVLPPLFSLAAVLERRGHFAEAGDVFLTIAQLTDAAWHPDLAYESLLRAGACLRRTDDLAWADRAYTQAAQLAQKDRDALRLLQAKLGRAQVTWARGDLRAADAMLEGLVDEAEQAQSAAMTSRLLHERATLAWVRGEFELAVRWAFRAFDLAPNARERDAILTALACYLDGVEAPDAAQVARGAIELHRLARTRPVPRTAESDRATAIELAREVARALRAQHPEAGAP